MSAITVPQARLSHSRSPALAVRALPSHSRSPALAVRALRVLTGFAVATALLGASGIAAAQQAAPKGSKVITISEITIVGRVQKPIASVDVSKIQPKLTLAELRQPFLERIEQAATKDPF